MPNYRLQWAQQNYLSPEKVISCIENFKGPLMVDFNDWSRCWDFLGDTIFLYLGIHPFRFP